MDGRGKDTCVFFLKGRCTRNPCPFIHQSRYDFGASPRNRNKEKVRVFDFGASPRDRNKEKVRVCHKWLKGHCWLGQSCQYLHDISQEVDLWHSKASPMAQRE